MQKSASVILLFLFTVLSTIAHAQEVQQASVTFQVKHAAGSTATGTFSPVTAVLKYDPAKPADLSISGSVLAASINTGLGVRDKQIRKEAYLDVAKHPTIQLEVSKASVVAVNKWQSQAKITLKGTTKVYPIIILSEPLGNKQYRFTSSFMLNRLDHKVGESSWLLADSVRVSLELKAAVK